MRDDGDEVAVCDDDQLVGEVSGERLAQGVAALCWLALARPANRRQETLSWGVTLLAPVIILIIGNY